MSTDNEQALTALKAQKREAEQAQMRAASRVELADERVVAAKARLDKMKFGSVDEARTATTKLDAKAKELLADAKRKLESL